MSRGPFEWTLHVGDLLSDPELGQCRPATVGVWLWLLLAMVKAGRSGELVGTIESLSRIAKVEPGELAAAIADLAATGAAEVAVFVDGKWERCLPLSEADKAPVAHFPQAVENLCKTCGRPADSAPAAVTKAGHVTLAAGSVPVVSRVRNRRMFREDAERKKARHRKAKERARKTAEEREP